MNIKLAPDHDPHFLLEMQAMDIIIRHDFNDKFFDSRLPDMFIEVTPAMDGNVNGQCVFEDGNITIQLAPECFEQMEDGEMRAILLHELIHAHTRAADHADPRFILACKGIATLLDLAVPETRHHFENFPLAMLPFR